jgi:hypothetical protein
VFTPAIAEAQKDQAAAAAKAADDESEQLAKNSRIRSAEDITI